MPSTLLLLQNSAFLLAALGCDDNPLTAVISQVVTWLSVAISVKRVGFQPPVTIAWRPFAVTASEGSNTWKYTSESAISTFIGSLVDVVATGTSRTLYNDPALRYLNWNIVSRVSPTPNFSEFIIFVVESVAHLLVSLSYSNIVHFSVGWQMVPSSLLARDTLILAVVLFR